MTDKLLPCPFCGSEPDGFTHIGEVVALDDGLGTEFVEWNDARRDLKAGTQIYAASPPHPSAPKADDMVKVQMLEALEELMHARTDKAEALATAAIAAYTAFLT